MALKRKRRASPSSKGLAAGEQLKRSTLAGHAPLTWSWVGTEVQDIAQITQEHLLLTCGLSKRNKHTFCGNKYSPTRAGEIPIPKPLKDRLDEPEEGELASDVIVISDDESPSCSKRSCKNNPNCLNYLGQEQWEDEGAAWDKFSQEAQLGENPVLVARDPDLPVGLRNLGATCYANAFLQVWFRDLAFRSGVYQCQFPKGNVEKYKDSPIFQLQVTFAALQESTQNVFNPTKLVESLQLRTAEQQDAQEFSKLFMSHLDAEFRKQINPSLQSLITNQFEGTQVYGTICHRCKYRSEHETKFREIEISFEGNSNLEDRIGALLEHEKLTGDNQYLCSQCEELQDATRYTELRQLPPVVHFSLLRFVYDLQTMERKKSKHAISFPTSINMAQFLGPSKAAHRETPAPVNYELRGVLLHKGPSAYHGHYEAQVYDTTNQAWYQFNDEVVTKIKDLGDKRSPQKGSNDNGKQSNASSQSSKSTSNSKKRRRVDDSDDEKPGDMQANPPNVSTSDSRTKRITSKEAYMLIYVRVDDDMVIDPPSPPAQAMEHVNGLNLLHDQACEAFSTRELVLKAQFEDLRRKIRNIYQSWDVSSDTEDCVVASATALKSWLSDQCIAANSPKPPGGALASAAATEEKDSPSSDTMEATPTVSNSSHSIPVDDILCSHKLLDPRKAAMMKRITKAACDSIRIDTKCLFDPELTSSDVCTDCVKASFSERLYQVEHPRQVNRFDKLTAENDAEPGYWISKQWLRDWRLAKPKMHAASEPDPSPGCPDFDSHVRCEHQNLSTNITNRTRICQDAYLLLKDLFPSWDAISTDAEVCPVCDVLIHNSKEHKLAFRKQAEDEKARLKHMHDNALNGNMALLENVRCAIVPAQFVRAWRKWLTRPTDNERPEAIDNSAFFCRHDQLVFDPSSSLDMDSTLSVVKLSDWEILQTLYPAGPLITVENKVAENEALPRLVADIDVCAECRRERRTVWDTTEITIRISRPQHEEKTSPAEVQKPLVTYSARATGARQSKRLRQVKEHGEKRKFLITKTMTVKDIKVAIQAEMKIPTICQRLSYQEKELDDNAVDVATLGILANDILDLREENEVHDLDSDFDDVPASKKPRDEGAGFGGTLLGSSQPSSSREDTPMAEKPCPQCTFANETDASACLICEFPFE
ncbi:hypothetical protein HGRIS_012863 [Hohenbuehelia grisea]|uniref:ubiquitinyl hydrolase 1 n=1 Tax=Hohenbuehelia grisea TaxID=104357 RepID=A0ABR3ITW0_9AGAR